MRGDSAKGKDGADGVGTRPETEPGCAAAIKGAARCATGGERIVKKAGEGDCKVEMARAPPTGASGKRSQGSR